MKSSRNYAVKVGLVLLTFLSTCESSLAVMPNLFGGVRRAFSVTNTRFSNRGIKFATAGVTSFAVGSMVYSQRDEIGLRILRTYHRQVAARHEKMLEKINQKGRHSNSLLEEGLNSHAELLKHLEEKLAALELKQSLKRSQNAG